MSDSPDLAGLEKVYRHHVALVVAGDLKGVMADMLPATLPAVFEGVEVPRGRVDAAVVRSISLVDGVGVGEAIYSTATGDVGLRSSWVHDGESWKSDTLANFEVGQ